MLFERIRLVLHHEARQWVTSDISSIRISKIVFVIGIQNRNVFLQYKTSCLMREACPYKCWVLYTFYGFGFPVPTPQINTAHDSHSMTWSKILDCRMSENSSGENWVQLYLSLNICLWSLRVLGGPTLMKRLDSHHAHNVSENKVTLVVIRHYGFYHGLLGGIFDQRAPYTIRNTSFGRGLKTQYLI